MNNILHIPSLPNFKTSLEWGCISLCTPINTAMYFNIIRESIVMSPLIRNPAVKSKWRGRVFLLRIRMLFIFPALRKENESVSQPRGERRTGAICCMYLDSFYWLELNFVTGEVRYYYRFSDGVYCLQRKYLSRITLFVPQITRSVRLCSVIKKNKEDKIYYLDQTVPVAVLILCLHRFCDQCLLLSFITFGCFLVCISVHIPISNLRSEFGRISPSTFIRLSL